MRPTIVLAHPPLSLEPSSFYHTLSTVLILLLSYLYLHYHPTPQANWLLLSSVLLSQSGLNAESQGHAPWKILLYLFYATLAALTVFLFSLNAFPLNYKIPLITIFIFTASYLSWLKRQYYLPAFIILFFAILAYYSPCDFQLALARGFLLALSGLFTFLIRLPFFIHQRAQAFFHAKVIYLQQLKQVYRLIFYTAGPARPLFKVELEESHFQIAWSDCLSALQKLKTLASADYNQSLDRVWDLTLSLGSLRYRLTDFSVLNMSHAEMRMLQRAVLAILSELLRKKPRAVLSSAFAAFQEAIQQFEELYQSMLQTVAKEPLVLLLFIQDLYALKEELQALAAQEVKKNA